MFYGLLLAKEDRSVDAYRFLLARLSPVKITPLTRYNLVSVDKTRYKSNETLGEEAANAPATCHYAAAISVLVQAKESLSRARVMTKQFYKFDRSKYVLGVVVICLSSVKK